MLFQNAGKGNTVPNTPGFPKRTPLIMSTKSCAFGTLQTCTSLHGRPTNFCYTPPALKSKFIPVKKWKPQILITTGVSIPSLNCGKHLYKRRNFSLPKDPTTFNIRNLLLSDTRGSTPQRTLFVPFKTRLFPKLGATKVAKKLLNLWLP